jgi:hypothetical protein
VAAAALAAALAAGAAGCGGSGSNAETAGSSSSSSSSTTTTVATTTSTLPPTTVAPAAPPTTRPAPKPTVPATTSSTRPHPARRVYEQQWVPYATAGPLTLRLPSDHVEAIGFHQSGHDGAVAQAALPSAPRWFVMGDRERDTNPQGAADIVVEPDREVRAPITGTVRRGGRYTLYCKHTDEYVVIAPDARPDWEVKVLHVQGLGLVKGQHVEAGVTHLADRAHVLPFASQVEDDTGLPPWPHVHIEVVDPNVPDRPPEPCP